METTSYENTRRLQDAIGASLEKNSVFMWN